MFGGSSTSGAMDLPGETDDRFAPGKPVRPFSYPPRITSKL
jgi:hypothetical protein